MNQSNDYPNGSQQNDSQLSQTKQKLIASAIIERGLRSPRSRLEQPVVLRQSPIWSRTVVWTIVGVTAASLLWASIAKIEQVVPAQGQLKPQGTVKKIQAPVNGVVKEVYVEDGDRVKKGELLAILDSTASRAELASYQKILQSLDRENKFYRTLMEQPLDPAQVERALALLKLPKEVASLARNRTTLVAENQLFQIQLDSTASAINLTPDQLARLQAAKSESDSRAAAARLEMEQQQKQLNQNLVQLNDARIQLAKDRQVLGEIQVRNQLSLAQAQQSLTIEQKILDQINPLVEEGALGTLSYQRQQQEVNDRYATLVEQRSNGAVEYEKQQQQVQTRSAEIDQLLEEQQRLQLAIAQAQEQLTNTTSQTEKDVSDKIADNQKQIAEIDSQLTKLVVENDKRMAELDSQVSRAQVTLNYQELRSPVAGTVFDLEASPGFVPQPAQAEALLKIVPDDYLVAEVDVTNEDIGFVRQGMKADVRIDSFPYSEFGDIKGEVFSIGSDALPPDEIYRYYRFPVKVRLNEQSLKVNDRQIPLQSGMSVSVNIKVREERTVLSLFTELFTDKVESLKQVR
jgi:HlyD family secretion protein